MNFVDNFNTKFKQEYIF